MDDKTKSPEQNLKDAKFLPESFNLKLNEENYTLMLGTLQEYFVIKVYQEKNIKSQYISFLTIEQLYKISKSMRYFEGIDEIISFLKDKGQNKQIFLKQGKETIFFEFNVNSPKGGIDNISLKLDEFKKNDKEIISILINKIDKLESEIKILKEKLLASEKIISKNKKNIELLFEEIHLLKEKKENNNNKTNNDENNIKNKNSNDNDNEKNNKRNDDNITKDQTIDDKNKEINKDKKKKKNKKEKTNPKINEDKENNIEKKNEEKNNEESNGDKENKEENIKENNIDDKIEEKNDKENKEENIKESDNNKANEKDCSNENNKEIKDKNETDKDKE